MKKLIIYTLISTMSWLTIGCASNPNNMKGDHSNPAIYYNDECADLDSELLKVNDRIDTLHKKLESKYTNDIWQFWGGLLVLWPLWFFLEFGDHGMADEYKELIGKRTALESARGQCS